MSPQAIDQSPPAVPGAVDGVTVQTPVPLVVITGEFPDCAAAPLDTAKPRITLKVATAALFIDGPPAFMAVATGSDLDSAGGDAHYSIERGDRQRGFPVTKHHQCCRGGPATLRRRSRGAGPC
jgi:hypothetical protein